MLTTDKNHYQVDWYLHKSPVVIRVDSRLGHSQSLLLVHLLGQVRQVDGIEIWSLEQRIQTMLGTQVSLLLRQ